MLLTEPGWAEVLPTRRRLVHPYLPWRCLGISGESPCFLIERDQHQQDEPDLLSNFLVSSPEFLLEVLTQLGDCNYRVYRLHLSRDGGAESRLEQISAIKSYHAQGVSWFSHVGADGVTRPCLSWQPAPDPDATWTTEWSCERLLETHIVRETSPISRGL